MSKELKCCPTVSEQVEKVERSQLNISERVIEMKRLNINLSIKLSIGQFKL